MTNEADHPWLRPLWRRIALVAFCAAWSVFELVAGEPFWAVLAIGMTGLWGMAVSDQLQAEREQGVNDVDSCS